MPRDWKPIEELMPQLKFMATKMEAGGARGSLGAEDLVQAAAIRLLVLRERFDPRKSKWKTFALPRARWAMADACRELDHVPRLARARARKEGKALPQVLSLQTAPFDLVPRDMAARGSQSPADLAGRGDVWRRVGEILGVRGRLVLESYFVRGLRLWQIGRDLGLSESRVCQLLAKYLAKLRHRWRVG